MGPIPFKLLKIPEPQIKFKLSPSIFQRDITKYKPYSNDESIESGIRLVYTKEVQNEVKSFIKDLQNKYREWKWNCNFEISEDVEPRPIEDGTIERIIDESPRDSIIVVFGKEFRDFWRHKALAMLKGKRLQIVRTDVFIRNYAKQEPDSLTRYYYLLNFTVQLYSKANGTPWILELNQVNFKFAREESVILGLSFGKKDNSIYYGIAQVVDHLGLTLKFEIFDAGYHNVDGYYIPKEKMERILKEAMDFYKHKYGSAPKNIYIYKSSKFLDEEIEGVKLADPECYYLVHTKMSGLPVRGYNTMTADYTMDRGTALIYPERNWCALWTTGNLGKSKHGLGTPKSIEIEISTNSKMDSKTLIEHTGFQSLALTKIDWEHANWNIRRPAVFKYSSRAIELCRHLPPVNKGIGRLDVRDLM